MIFHLWVAKQHLNSLRPSDAIWRHRSAIIWANIGSGNGLLPDSTKPSPETMFTSVNIILLKLFSHLSGANELPHCGLVTPFGALIWFNNASGNGLLPDGTKPLPEPMLTNHQWGPVRSCDNHMRHHKRYLSHQLLNLAWKLLIWIFSQIPQGPMS